MNWEANKSNIRQVDWLGKGTPEPAALVAKAADAPLGLPPIDQMIVAGDRIAIALCGAGLGELHLLDAVLVWLGSQGVDADHIAVVFPGWQWNEEDTARFESLAGGHADVQWFNHSPQDPYGSSYLAANQAGDPIYLSRALVDADVVMAVRSCQAGSPFDSAFRVTSDLYPLFTNAESWKRLYESYALETRKAGPWQGEESELENWLGAVTWWEAHVSPTGALSDVLAGLESQLAGGRDHVLNALWDSEAVEPTDMVVLDFDDGLNWNWGRVLTAIRQARLVFERDCTLLVRGSLPELLPSESDLESNDQAVEWLRDWTRMECERLGAAGDLWIQSAPVEILQDSEGWHWVDGDREAARLAERFESCLILPGAFVMSGGCNLLLSRS